MTAITVALRSNPGRYTQLGSPRLVNAYAEQQGSDNKQPYAVLPCPGMVLFSSVTDTPCRGLIYLDDLDLIYTVHSSSVYKVDSAGSATYVGLLPGTDNVQMSRNMATDDNGENAPQISIHSENGEFYIESDQVKTVTDMADLDNPPDVVSQDYGDSFTVYGSSAGQFYWSAPNDAASVDAADFATAEQSADKLVRVKFDRGDLFIFGQRTVEPWRLTASGFEPITSAAIQKGLSATFGLVSSDNTLMWPTNDNVFVRLNGYDPVKISTHGIDRLLQDETNRSGIISIAYDFDGHSFANWTGTDWSASYDASTQTWHDRESYGQSFWRARHGVSAWNKTIVGDTLTGNLYYLEKNTFTEGGNPLIWGIDTQTIHAFPNGAIIDAIHIDMVTGVGLITGQGSDPVLMLSWSTDGGNTFTGNRQLSLGSRGDAVRVTARRLGRFGPKGIVLRLRISDPVVRAINSIDIKTRELKK